MTESIVGRRTDVGERKKENKYSNRWRQRLETLASGTESGVWGDPRLLEWVLICPLLLSFTILLYYK